MNPLLVKTAIVGAGSAGMNAYRQARKAGRTVLIEGGSYGTTCARVGCMPSKLLIAAANAAHSVHEAERFGVQTNGVKVDGRMVMERVRRERDRFVGFVLESIENFPSEDRILGQARFIGPRKLIVGSLEIHAETVILATGSRTHYPDFLSEVRELVVSNDEVFSWEDLPKSLLVIGTGVIGLEVAQALGRLGVKVTVMGRGGRFGIFTDPELASAAKACFPEISLIPKGSVTKVLRQNDKVMVDISHPQGSCQDSYDRILCAAGRKPNVEGLDLQKSGLQLDPYGVPYFNRQTLQCGNSRVFLAGDVTGEYQLLHEASDEGQHAGKMAAEAPVIIPMNRRSPLNIAFTEPQMAIAGNSYSDLVPESYVIGKVSFENQGRSRIMLENRGLMHVYFAKDSHRLLGAEILGPRAEHLGHLLAWSHQMGLTVEQMLAMPFYHPVIEEGLRTALRDALTQLS